MSEEDKRLLLIDLCARLPYGVKAHYIVYHTVEDNYDEWDNVINDLSDFIPGCKLYLRPMSSMTEEEKDHFNYLVSLGFTGISTNSKDNIIDWLNSHHFDYRGLIEKGLALEAPEGMY